MRSYEYLDPSRVLEIRGEDCTNCRHLTVTSVFGFDAWWCDNNKAPQSKRKRAPASRCDEWKHKQQDGGQ